MQTFVQEAKGELPKLKQAEEAKAIPTLRSKLRHKTVPTCTTIVKNNKAKS